MFTGGIFYEGDADACKEVEAEAIQLAGLVRVKKDAAGLDNVTEEFELPQGGIVRIIDNAYVSRILIIRGKVAEPEKERPELEEEISGTFRKLVAVHRDDGGTTDPSTVWSKPDKESPWYGRASAQTYGGVDWVSTDKTKCITYTDPLRSTYGQRYGVFHRTPATTSLYSNGRLFAGCPQGVAGAAVYTDPDHGDYFVIATMSESFSDNPGDYVRIYTHKLTVDVEEYLTGTGSLSSGDWTLVDTYNAPAANGDVSMINFSGDGSKAIGVYVPDAGNNTYAVEFTFSTDISGNLQASANWALATYTGWTNEWQATLFSDVLPESPSTYSYEEIGQVANRDIPSVYVIDTCVAGDWMALYGSALLSHWAGILGEAVYYASSADTTEAGSFTNNDSQLPDYDLGFPSPTTSFGAYPVGYTTHTIRKVSDDAFVDTVRVGFVYKYTFHMTNVSGSYGLKKIDDGEWLMAADYDASGNPVYATLFYDAEKSDDILKTSVGSETWHRLYQHPAIVITSNGDCVLDSEVGHTLSASSQITHTNQAVFLKAPFLPDGQMQVSGMRSPTTGRDTSAVFNWAVTNPNVDIDDNLVNPRWDNGNETETCELTAAYQSYFFDILYMDLRVGNYVTYEYGNTYEPNGIGDDHRAPVLDTWYYQVAFFNPAEGHARYVAWLNEDSTPDAATISTNRSQNNWADSGPTSHQSLFWTYNWQSGASTPDGSMLFCVFEWASPGSEIIYDSAQGTIYNAIEHSDLPQNQPGQELYKISVL